ncbi:GNAT family N-acetyltransferase [Streptomyces sp. ISL-14]|nr:GNAT family N-acetyltransferase [Streptomyces sp. ISL-14]
MIMKIRDLDSDYGQQLFKLQKEAYKVEADIIGFADIPPLLETYEQFIHCHETFLCYLKGDALAGAISFSKENGQMLICRMVVHPDYFRQGIANALLHALQLQGDWEKISVSTGKMNLPARNLYEKNGFTHKADIEASPHFFISIFEKKRSFYVCHDKKHKK